MRQIYGASGARKAMPAPRGGSHSQTPEGGNQLPEGGKQRLEGGKRGLPPLPTNLAEKVARLGAVDG